MENYFNELSNEAMHQGMEYGDEANEGCETSVLDVKKKILSIAGVGCAYDKANKQIVEIFPSPMKYLEVIDLFNKRNMNKDKEEKKVSRMRLDALCNDVRNDWERCSAIYEGVKKKERTELKIAKLQEMRIRRLNEKNDYVDELDKYFESIASSEFKFSDVKVCTYFYLLRRAMYQTLCPEFLIERMRELLIWDADEIHRKIEQIKKLERKQEHIDKYNAQMAEVEKAEEINAVDDLID